MSEQYVKFSLGDIPENGIHVNGRIYPKAALEKALQKYADKMIIPRHLQTQQEHPAQPAISIRSHDKWDLCQVINHE